MTSRAGRQPIERNLAMELVRVTEAAAMTASQHMGKGDKELVDQAAVDAMRHTLDGIRMDGVVVIGEGEKDEAHGHSVWFAFCSIWSTDEIILELIS